VQRLEERPDDALVELLPEQRQVDELDERRLQLVTDPLRGGGDRVPVDALVVSLVPSEA
jgi:hypothetical protein